MQAPVSDGAPNRPSAIVLAHGLGFGTIGLNVNLLLALMDPTQLLWLLVVGLGVLLMAWLGVLLMKGTQKRRITPLFHGVVLIYAVNLVSFGLEQHQSYRFMVLSFGLWSMVGVLATLIQRRIRTVRYE